MQRAAEVESDASNNDEVQSRKTNSNTCMGTLRLKLLLKKASKSAERATEAAKGKGGTQTAAASSASCPRTSPSARAPPSTTGHHADVAEFTKGVLLW